MPRTPAAEWAAYQAAFRTLVSRVDGGERRAVRAVSARIDTREQWATVWRAVQRHATQLAIYRELGQLTPEHHEALWGTETFHRVLSLVNGGREVETDLFSGL